MKNLNDKSILIIDDDAGMLGSLTKVLSSEGATTISAISPEDALEILTARKERVDLVITDLHMPVMTGLTVVHAVHKAFPDVPIIVLTAYGSPDVKTECYSQGAVGFLEKPLDTTQLLRAIEGAFASR
jgi:DNA-binding NtrC family response regulator